MSETVEYLIREEGDGHAVTRFDGRPVVTYHVQNGKCSCPAVGQCKHLAMIEAWKLVFRDIERRWYNEELKETLRRVGL